MNNIQIIHCVAIDGSSSMGQWLRCSIVGTENRKEKLKMETQDRIHIGNLKRSITFATLLS